MLTPASLASGGACCRVVSGDTGLDRSEGGLPMAKDKKSKKKDKKKKGKKGKKK